MPAAVPWWISVPVTVAAALAVTQWLARGMTSPLREMTDAARGGWPAATTASGSRRPRSDEVGRPGPRVQRDGRRPRLRRPASADSSSRPSRTSCARRWPPSGPCWRTSSTASCSPTTRPCAAALRQSERLSALVADLLDLSRIDAGVAPLAVTEVRVADLLRACGRRGRRRRPARPGAARDAAPPTSPCQADPARLAQLVANLVDNAVRHSPPDGEVLVSARAVDATTWWLEVRDEGPGIPADRVERVFDRFGVRRRLRPAAPASAWPSPAGSASCTAARSPPCRPPTARPARACAPCCPCRTPEPTDPTHLPEAAHHARPSTPASQPTPPRPRPPTATAPAHAHPRGLPATPARTGPPAAAAERAARRRLAGANAAAPAAGRARRAGHRRLGGAHLARAQRRPRGRPDDARGRAAHVVGSRATARSAWTDRLRRARRAARDGRRCSATPAGSSPCAVLVGVVVAAAGTTLARTLLAVPLSVVAWPLSALRGPAAARSHDHRDQPGLRCSGRCCARSGLSLVALALFGGLFASGDAVFGAWADALVPDLGWDTIVARTFVLALVAGVALTGAYLALNPPRVADVALPAHAARSPTPGSGRCPSGIVVALFAGFLVAQATAMWGGHEYLERTTGLTYAEYVHQGFGAAHRRDLPHRRRRRPRRCASRPARPRATGCSCACSSAPVPADPRRRRQRAVPDVALPGRLRLHGAAGLRRRVRAVAGPGRRDAPRRRRPAVRLGGCRARCSSPPPSSRSASPR